MVAQFEHTFPGAVCTISWFALDCSRGVGEFSSRLTGVSTFVTISELVLVWGFSESSDFSESSGFLEVLKVSEISEFCDFFNSSGFANDSLPGEWLSFAAESGSRSSSGRLISGISFS